MTDRMYGQPIDTPLEAEPDARSVEALEMWRIALLHVGVLGGWDRTITAWLAGKGPDVVTTVASLLRRAWQAGVVAGRREVLDEAGDLHVLAADIERIADHADYALTEGETGAQEVLEELLQDVRARVSMDVPHSDHLDRAARQARGRYFAILAGDLSTAQRHLAVCVAVDTAAVTTTCDSTLAAAVRAIVDADRQVDEAVAEVDEEPPAGPVRSVVLHPADAGVLRDLLESDGHRVLWAHRSDDLSVDVRLSPADVAQLRAAAGDADVTSGAYIDAEDGRLVVAGARYEVTVGWPRGTRRPADDAQVDAVRGCGAEDQGDDQDAEDEEIVWVGRPGDYDPAGHEGWDDDRDDGHSTPLAAAGLASGVLGVAGLVATHSGSPGLGLVLAAVGGITGVVVLALGRRGRDGGAS